MLSTHPCDRFWLCSVMGGLILHQTQELALFSMECCLSGSLERAASRLLMFDSKVLIIVHCWHVLISNTIPAVCLFTDHLLYKLPLGID